MRHLRVGVAGASRGAGFIDGVREERDRATLAAVYDPDRERCASFAEEYGVARMCSSFDELLDHSDLVVVASPQQYHVPQAVAALERGIHVLSEVPAAVSMEQAQQLVAAVRTSTAQYMLAENYMYTRENLVVSAMARAGEFGDLYYGEGEYLHEMKSWHTAADGSPTWRRYWQAGRDGVTYPTHSLGPLLEWFDDRIVAVSCVGAGRHTQPGYELQDTVILLARTQRERLLQMRLDLLSNRPELWSYYSVQGTAGAYESPRVPQAQPVVYLHGRSAPDQWEPLESYADRFLPARYRDSFHGQSAHEHHWGSDTWPVREFIDAIFADRGSPIDIYRSLDMTLPGLVSEQSIAQHGQWLQVPNPRYFTSGIGVNPLPEVRMT